MYGKSFIRWLAINASHRDLDIDGDSWYEMHAAMAEVDLIPADGQLYHHSDEEVKRMVVEAARKLEAEGNKS